jgi:sugar phosphate isomerase/epimerase
MARLNGGPFYLFFYCQHRYQLYLLPMIKKEYKFGISTTVDYSVPIEIQLPAIARAGFDFVSLGANMEHSGFLKPARFRSVMKIASELGLIIESAHFPFGREYDLAALDEKMREHAANALAEFVSLARDSGIRIAIVHPHDYFNDSKEGCLNRATEALQKAIANTPSKVKIAIENLPGRTCSWITTELLKRFDHGNVGFCYDSSHENISGEAFHLLKHHYNRMITSHLSDNYGRADEHLIPGDGTIDWPGVKTYFDKSEQLDHILFEVGTGTALNEPLDEFLKRTILCARNIFGADKQK